MWPLEDHAQEVAGFYGTVLKLFSMFLNGLHGDTESSPSNFADDTKCGVTYTGNSSTSVRKHPDV